MAINPMRLVVIASAPSAVKGSNQLLAAWPTVSISANVSARKIESNRPASGNRPPWTALSCRGEGAVMAE